MMRSEAVTEEQERVVQRARDNMAFHDQRTALVRWLSNYAPDPKRTFSQLHWYTITRVGRDWTVAIGFADETVPFHTFLVDGRAPAPPVMEWRPPPPEPVKHRFTVPPPRPVPEFREGLTPAKLGDMMRMVRDISVLRPRDLLQPFVFDDRPTATEMREKERAARQMLDQISTRYLLQPMIMPRSVLSMMTIGDEHPRPNPPPAPTRRNQ